ncbi:EAL domain-containing protein [Marinomonas sp. RSW2]|uniref:EAL domain-containing protein n=1 Tax=Marinomonas maritima TaxID=2940935 RepID=A0ABT5W9A1_9GAMM|nr:EAL domain-containing protein [Marinomonas maritima]MDE8601386.1 EAL domain-containing protein [Marinomonas maritima]
MTQKTRMLLTFFINFSVLIVFTVSVFIMGNTWQQKRTSEATEKERQFYFVKVESHLNGVVSFIASISDLYTGDCSRSVVLHMRKELFNIPGAIEFGVIQKEGDHGVVVCNSWGDKDRIKVREPVPHDGFLMTGPHTINSLKMPVFVIKKTVGNFEYNVIIKKNSIDAFFNNGSDMIISNGGNITGEGVLDENYRRSDVINNLIYSVSSSFSKKEHNLYFIPIALFLFILVYFLVTPKWVRTIDRILLKRKIENHYYYNEYQPIVDTKNGRLFSIEVFLRGQDEANAKDTIAKMKSLDLSIDHTIFQIRQIEQSFSKGFILQNNFQVNISSHHLQSAFFVEHILQLKALTCTSLILEMTEDDNLMLQKNIVKEHMARLKEKGCRFAIDDFGIEYSGLSYISEFDFDIVKTDKIFIDDKDQNTAILKSIIAFCNELDIDCIAEGIETKDDNEKINQIGIHLHQGWYHGRPVSAEKITAYTVQL